MTEIALCASVFGWLVMGGWSFNDLVQEATDSDQRIALLIFCLILAPFALGMALSGRRK